MKQPWQGENNEKLRRLLMDYYAVTGQRIGVFDADFHMLMAYPEPHCALCSWLRSSETGARRCREWDNHGMREAKRTGRPVVYRCHAGLLEVCVPLQEEGGEAGRISDVWPAAVRRGFTGTMGGYPPPVRGLIS